MHLAEVVRGNEQGDSGPVIVQLARPAQAKPGKSLVEMPHAQIGTFDVAGANAVPAWGTGNGADRHTDKSCLKTFGENPRL